MASTQSWRNLLSQWMSACLAGVITGASLQLEQLTEALTYKDRSTYMEGCQKLLLSKESICCFGQFSPCRKGLKQQGTMEPVVPSQPHSCWCCTHQHSPCLGPAAHLRLKPKPALTASTQAPKKAQLWPSSTAWRNHGRQERGWQTHNSKPGSWPHPASSPQPDTSAAALFLSKNLCTCKSQRWRASGTWGGMCPTAQALPTQSRAGRHRIPALWPSPPHPHWARSRCSSWTAIPSRPSGRAASPSAWPECQLLPLPVLFGTPTVPRGGCY